MYKDADNGSTVSFYMYYEEEQVKVSAQFDKKSKWHISEESKPHQVGINFKFGFLHVYVCIYIYIIYAIVRCAVMELLMGLNYSLWQRSPNHFKYNLYYSYCTLTVYCNDYFSGGQSCSRRV